MVTLTDPVKPDEVLDLLSGASYSALYKHRMTTTEQSKTEVTAGEVINCVYEHTKYSDDPDFVITTHRRDDGRQSVWLTMQGGMTQYEVVLRG